MRQIRAALAVTFGLWCIGWCIIFKINRLTSTLNVPTVDVMDVLSIGSLTRPDFQRMQRATFGAHASVRYFYAATEHNDSDPSCAHDLSNAQVMSVIHFCNMTTLPNGSTSNHKNALDGRGENTPNAMKLLMRTKFRPRREPPGWLCAQKRPVEALARLLIRYRSNNLLVNGTSVNINDSSNTGTVSIIPQYVLVVDDDTYLPNMKALVRLLHRHYPPHVAFAISPCLVGGTAKFNMPFGGFGTILTRAALQNLLHPIDCISSSATASSTTKTTRSALRSRLCCNQLDANLMGEKMFFRNNMSIADLMYAFSAQQPYTAFPDPTSATADGNAPAPMETAKSSAASGWNPNAGFCMHSDHALAYFINMYYIAVSDAQLPRVSRVHHRTDNDASSRPWLTRTGYVKIKPKEQCAHREEQCHVVDSLFCHYITPQQMEALYNEKRGSFQPSHG